ncbi:hypothetical protein L1I30_08735 [Gillisia sp. M10.2A]|uniref:Hydrolase n=1 Tax=Gillisia lutea TaxID=2909668 RepID=A0ABS9EFT3_9FLAO|nr:hypothetical protein [Gillisia lutea]MCF4101749.1 hypothetical protein [Gillisia lutea]
MRSKIILYLFIFSVLFTIFIYVNDKKILDAKEERIQNQHERITELEHQNEQLANANLRLNYFSLTGNEEAISYFENQGVDVTQLAASIEDQIISRNKAYQDNELVPFEGMEGNMRINKVKILNHKWIIADFTDGTYWGEILISYQIDEDNNLQLTTEKSFLYPQS